MIFSVISLLIIIVCIVFIIRIIARRWHALISIDLEHLPAERDARTKKKILSDRLRRQFYTVKAGVAEKGLPLFSRVSDSFVDMSQRLHKTVESALQKKMIKKEESLMTTDTPPPTALSRLLRDAQLYFDKGQYDDAEKKYIDALALDSKNLDAYSGLALIYEEQREWAGAQEVLEYLRNHLREYVAQDGLDPAEQSSYQMRLAESLNQLSGVYFDLEKKAEARQAIEEALDLQPQNPKFLDAALELYIILGQPKEARGVLRRLKDANPENQKIEGFEERIGEL